MYYCHAWKYGYIGTSTINDNKLTHSNLAFRLLKETLSLCCFICKKFFVVLLFNSIYFN